MKIQIHEYAETLDDIDAYKVTLIVDETEYNILEKNNGLYISIDGQIEILPRATNVIQITQIS